MEEEISICLSKLGCDKLFSLTFSDFFAAKLAGIETRAVGCFSGLQGRKLRAKSGLSRLEVMK